MRRMTVIACLALSLGLLAGMGPGSAAAASKKVVEGTVYDATCVTICQPECPPPPHCGPIRAQQARSTTVCPLTRQIVCPLYRAADDICLPSSNCGGFPVYTGEGSLVNVRKRGSAAVIARLPVVEGHFGIRLAPGEYVLHPYMAEEQCWSAESVTAKVTAKLKSPVPVALDATNRCAVHAD